MKIEHFKMERMQSTWENIVDYNLSDSGIFPLSFRELIEQDELNDILETKLGYLQTNGTPELREKISQYYPGTTIENILVTTGSVESNFLLMWGQVEPEDQVVFMLPNYMQMWGLMRAFGARAKAFFLREELDWNPDLNDLKKIITDQTKIVVITNPNNPTGGQLSEEARQTIIELADKANAWIISDEVYQGAELDGNMTQSFWGAYKKVAVTCGLSKAYGLPGLRAGWIVAPEELIQRTWPYHDYTTISLSSLSDRLARIVLTPENRKKILERSRRILRTNLTILDDWFKRQNGFFHYVPPKAGAIVFARYNFNMNSTELANKLREEKNVLLIPGDHFEMDHYMRFGYGEEKEYLIKALDRVEEGLKEIQKKA